MIALFPMPLSWLLRRSVLKPGKTQSWRRPSPHLREVWIARNMNGERPQSRSLFERISQGARTGLHTLPQCRCSTHAACPSHRSPHGPFQATRSPVQGRTPPSPMAGPVNGMGVVREGGALRELARTLPPYRKSNAFASSPACSSGWTRRHPGQGRPPQSSLLA